MGGSWKGRARGSLQDICGRGLRRGPSCLVDVLLLGGLQPWIWGSRTQNVVEAGKTDVKAQPKLSKELVIEAVEFLRDVIAQQGREEAGDISLFGQKKVETSPWPGNVAAWGLGSQSDLRGVVSRK